MAEAKKGVLKPSSEVQQEKPKLPPRQYQPIINARPRPSQGLNGNPVQDTSHLAPPPQRLSQLDVQSEPSATDYRRDLRKLTGYLIPYPKPQFPGKAPEEIPQRYLVYTPPAPPFHEKPSNGKREGLTQWVRRHWYKELREAKMRAPPNGRETKWKRLKWKGTRATDWGIRKVKSSNLEFLNRVAGLQDEADRLALDVYRRSIAPEEIRLIYPPAVNCADVVDHEALKEEFVASMLRTKKKAYKHSICATLLFPPALVFDTVIVPIWPFGGAAEVDFVWLYASLRGAKTSRDVTKRLALKDREDKRAEKARKRRSKQKNENKEQTEGSTMISSDRQNGQFEAATADHGNASSKHKKHPDQSRHLSLNFIESSRIQILEQYLAAACHKRNPELFPVYASQPSETQVLEAIGWSHSDQDPYPNPSLADVQTVIHHEDGNHRSAARHTSARNSASRPESRRERDAGGAGGLAQKALSWEDEQWEILQVKDDLKDVFSKGAKEWDGWCRLWRKKPGKAMKR